MCNLLCPIPSVRLVSDYSTTVGSVWVRRMSIGIDSYERAMSSPGSLIDIDGKFRAQTLDSTPLNSTRIREEERREESCPRRRAGEPVVHSFRTEIETETEQPAKQASSSFAKSDDRSHHPKQCTWTQSAAVSERPYMYIYMDAYAYTIPRS